jgi:hypothetical protein
VHNLLVPGVITDIADVEAFGWVGIQDRPNQILALDGQEVGHLVLSFDDLSVELLGILIFKRQVTTNHRI